MKVIGLVILSLTIYSCIIDAKSDSSDEFSSVLPTMFWRWNEQCKDGYIAYHISGENDCKDFECSLPPHFNVSYTVLTENGTICDDNKVCMGGKCVSINIANFPLSLGDMHFENGENCSTYLNEADNFRFAEEFCMDTWNKINCPVTCRKYGALTCRDKSSNICPRYYYQGCNGGIIPELNNITVKELCPFSCGLCATTPLKCPANNSTFICLNGGTCQNLNPNTAGLFGFKCNCPKGYTGELCERVNPCDYSNCGPGLTCVQIATYNYMCVPANARKH